MSKLREVVSGGQTGVDQAALLAARAGGIATGGWAPKDWLTEEGPAPWLADFGLAEAPTDSYPARTRLNVRDSDATLWLGDWHSPSRRATLDACRAIDRPFLIAYKGVSRPSHVLDWLAKLDVATLNVAGDRESTSPGIGARSETFLLPLFRRLVAEGRAEVRRAE
jgi:hypothetical protein